MQTVRDPQGTVWTVARRWQNHRIRWFGPTQLAKSIDASSIGAVDDLGGVVFGLLLLVAVVAAVFLLLPGLLLFAQLVLVTVLAGVGAAGRVLFGRPWRVEAEAADGRRRAWLVKGWTQSGAAVGHIGAAIASGRQVWVPDGYEIRP